MGLGHLFTFVTPTPVFSPYFHPVVHSEQSTPRAPSKPILHERNDSADSDETVFFESPEFPRPPYPLHGLQHHSSPSHTSFNDVADNNDMAPPKQSSIHALNAYFVEALQIPSDEAKRLDYYSGKESLLVSDSRGCWSCCCGGVNTRARCSSATAERFHTIRPACSNLAGATPSFPRHSSLTPAQQKAHIWRRYLHSIAAANSAREPADTPVLEAARNVQSWAAADPPYSPETWDQVTRLHLALTGAVLAWRRNPRVRARILARNVRGLYGLGPNGECAARLLT